MAYQVLTADERTLIVDTETGIQVRVREKINKHTEGSKAYCLATLYRISGGFIPEKVYIFEAVNNAGLAQLKKLVDFFFTTLLETELYVKEVPQDSLLYKEEALRLYWKNQEEMNDGTASTICTGRTE